MKSFFKYFFIAFLINYIIGMAIAVVYRLRVGSWKQMW